MALRTLLTVLIFAFWLSPIEAAVKHDPFVVVTPPNSGYLLLTQAMEQLTDKRCKDLVYTHILTHEEWKKELRKAAASRAFIHMHALPKKEQVKSLKKLGYKVIFLISDPRDHALQLLFVDPRARRLSPARSALDND